MKRRGRQCRVNHYSARQRKSRHEEGEFIAILDTTVQVNQLLRNTLTHFLLPSDGSIWVDGKDVTKEENTFAVRQTAGMVFQNPDNQIIASVVEEDVGFGPGEYRRADG